ncbi:NAD(P)H-dependent oxidoreductase [Chitinophaga pollutisoli]|uniref:NAD(P)H-dependent oxidoreductase n=1 Tax=Chitinophaga pollutisoli TaxID=3133966 RepID=A0ABZ2YIC7_9BACT
MKAKNILVILGHPNSESFCGALAGAYIKGASAAGHAVRVLRLGEMVFNPDLHQGYRARTPWEPALEAAWADIQWSEHMVWIYPTWWGTIPALMKGFIDRVFLPGKAFKYRENSPLWDKLLKGKSARLITTMDSPLWYNWLIYHNAGHRAMKNATLKFCGVKPVKITAFGKLRWQQTPAREKMLSKVENLGGFGK